MSLGSRDTRRGIDIRAALVLGSGGQWRGRAEEEGDGWDEGGDEEVYNKDARSALPEA